MRVVAQLPVAEDDALALVEDGPAELPEEATTVLVATNVLVARV